MRHAPPTFMRAALASIVVTAAAIDALSALLHSSWVLPIGSLAGALISLGNSILGTLETVVTGSGSQDRTRWGKWRDHFHRGQWRSPAGLPNHSHGNSQNRRNLRPTSEL